MANKKIQEIEGIGPVLGEKFEAAGVGDTDTLLGKGGTKAGRKAISEATELSPAVVVAAEVSGAIEIMVP